MKKHLLFIIAAAMVICSCERLFESKKERLDRMVGAHWDKWKSEGKDTTMCFVDFTEVIPVEWDTMVYINFDPYYDNEKKGVGSYMNDRYWKENESSRGYPEESLHFWKDGKLVYDIFLLMASDDERGVLFNTRSKFIVRPSSDAKFRLKKVGKYYKIRDQYEDE